MAERKRAQKSSSRSWDPVADWYTGWVGIEGSDHHRKVAIPALLELLDLERGEHVLDFGCGPGVLAPYISSAGGKYTGVDSSQKLIRFARRHHGRHGQFILGDVTDFEVMAEIQGKAFDAVTFLLSIQDIDPLAGALRNSAEALRAGGRIVLLMTHPCFRIPRQSGWGWDDQRRLRYRRIDRYLTPLAVPMKVYGAGRRGATRSHHRPLQEYVEELAKQELLVESIREIPGYSAKGGQDSKAERMANREIPLFLGLRAAKLT